MNRLLSVTEAAAVLGLSPQTLNRWRCERAGKGPRWLKLGGAIRYREADLVAYIERSAQSPEPGGAR